ncbi:hypothetical protein SEPCBS119000_004765 [Sporothrix epigloea]|uniref:C2H2-type domain-containing protein n=1 Tax=Sporothrix epigloea TaxID=1892477 RepID=A0ABP0DU70_9PEZI
MNDPAPTTMSFTCEPPCSREFKSAAALEQHKNNASRHTQGGQHPDSESVAGLGNDRFDGISSITMTDTIGVTSELHEAQAACIAAPEAESGPVTSQSPLVVQQTRFELPITPLDRFFASYPGFRYNRAQPPAASFQQLERYSGWEKRSEEQADAWQSYQKALIDEVRLFFGNENDLASWHQLCRATGIKELPPAISECKQTMRQTHVNIVDLIEWGRSGQRVGKPVKVYRSVAALSEYTLSTGKIFPANEVRGEDNEKNIVLRYLLRKLIRAQKQKHLRQYSRA